MILPQFLRQHKYNRASIFCPEFWNISRISVIFVNPVDEISFVWVHVVSFTF